MKTKSYKRMKGVTIFASLLCAMCIVWIIVQSYYISTHSGEGCIHWHEDLYPVQLTIFIGRLLFKTSFYELIIIFLAKQLKAIKNGILFPSVNTKIMYAIAACYFIGNSCSENVSTSLLFDGNTGSFVINADTWIYTALLVVFAIMYNFAVKVSEENNLTI
ncbi:MAG: hypothetical protein IKY37_02250 [Bacteroidaceae bacterium]|nr:hypothetical protein [Bacteroidaceae bacterium]